MSEDVYSVMLRHFWRLFWSVFDSFFGGNIRPVDITPQKRIENRLKRTPKMTEEHTIDTLLIFDLDDTLIDTSGKITPFKLQMSLNALGLSFPNVEKAYEDLLEKNRTLAKSKEALLSFAKENFASDQQIQSALIELSSVLPETFEVATTPYAKKVLEYFAKRAKLALVTVGKEPMQLDKLKKAGIEPSIFSMIRVLEGPEKKSAYREIQEEFCLSSEKVWVCGDRVEIDLRPGFELGFHTVHMRWGRGAHIARESWVTHSVDELSKLKEIIR